MTTPYRIILADPAWAFDDKLGPRGAAANYSCMRWEDICMLTLPAIADDALLFLWAVSSMLPEAIAVVHAWGFRVASQVVWVKTKKGVIDDTTDTNNLAFGMGRTVRGAHEVCLIGTRGSYSKLIRKKSVRSVLFAPRTEHSRKPDAMYDLIEELTDGEGPYLEMFARRPRTGWGSWGHDVGVHMETINAKQGEDVLGDELQPISPLSGALPQVLHGEALLRGNSV